MMIIMVMMMLLLFSMYFSRGLCKVIDQLIDNAVSAVEKIRQF